MSRYEAHHLKGTVTSRGGVMGSVQLPSSDVDMEQAIAKPLMAKMPQLAFLLSLRLLHMFQGGRQAHHVPQLAS